MDKISKCSPTTPMHVTEDFGLVSIIMPTYKQYILLHKAVESIKNQTYKNWELIVIDDNPDELYRKLNEQYFKDLQHSQIKYIQNDGNMGSTASRNRGIECSSGEYITFLDDDDWYEQFKIEKQLEAMHSTQSDISVCNLILLNEQGKVVDCRRRKYLKKKENTITAHLKYHITGTDTMMFRADFLKKIGGFDKENLGDEFYLMMKALQHNPKFIHVDYDGVFALVHSQTGLSSGNNKLLTEKILLEYKARYFHTLKKRDIRYIKMRHHLVVAVAHKKNKAYHRCFVELLKAFLLAPIGMFHILMGADR